LSRLIGIVVLFLAAAGAVFALPPGAWVGSWAVLGSGFIGFIAWASIGQQNSFLGPCTSRGPTHRDNFALTFDDGPEPECTPALLDLLARYQAKATFFLVGEHVEQHPGIARRIHDEGHQIGNHSYVHRPWLTIAFAGPLRRDLQRCQEAILTATNVRPGWFRAPYGIRTHATQPTAQRLGMQVAGWSTGGLDTLRHWSTDSIVGRICRRLQPGAIVLLHDRGPRPARTLEITERVLDQATRRGLRAVTLDHLLAEPAGGSAADSGPDAPAAPARG
jgi:peptidoglycan/xylan/chitin deacetylase (PgdA/CDA1 family)